MPVAVNCCGKPTATDANPGVMEMDTSDAGATDSETVGEDTDARVAVMPVVPAPSARAMPCASMLATAGALDAQFTCLLRFCVLPSL